jgi:hypothetical protein
MLTQNTIVRSDDKTSGHTRRKIHQEEKLGN